MEKNVDYIIQAATEAYHDVNSEDWEKRFEEMTWDWSEGSRAQVRVFVECLVKNIIRDDFFTVIRIHRKDLEEAGVENAEGLSCYTMKKIADDMRQGIMGSGAYDDALIEAVNVRVNNQPPSLD